MAKPNAFIKISGDLIDHIDVLKWIKDVCTTHSVVVCVGGGTQINATFEERGIALSKHGVLGRELSTFNDRQMARDILEENQARIQDLLDEHAISARVIIPVLDIGGVLCHVNGDTMAQTAYIGYDILYIATYIDRVGKKEKEFAHLPKVHIIGFEK
ncbi:MAG: hypothetical protein H8D63_01480 [Parcubacteria group bacterium]|nr:hypothetical protein [Parcubacteria group bacterium]